MKKKSGLLPAGLLSLLLLLAACGDGSETATEAAAGDGNGAMEGGDLAVEDDENDGSAMEGMDGMADGEHSHGEGIEVPDGMTVPTISIDAEPDSLSGHNLFIDIADFSIAPERASTDPVDGEGHLHLYIDGERTLRFYNQALHLTGLEPGDHEIMVEVSANNHSAYLVDGEPITAVTTITVAEPEPGADEGDGDHGDGELFEPENPPALDVTVTEDPKSGWNLFADVSGLEFDAAAVGSEPVDGDGHLHLYIDGEKMTRLYGPWWHIKALDVGSHEIMVEASANDHSAYGLDGEPVRAMTVVEVSEEAAMAAAGHSDTDHSDTDDDDTDHTDADHDAMEDEGHDDDDGEEGHGHDGDGEALGIPAADADVVITGSLANGEVEVDDRRFKVPTGSTVGILFRSDKAEQVHVHGYDLLAAVGPDRTVDLAFLADSPGTFEVELEMSGRFLFEIQVN